MADKKRSSQIWDFLVVLAVVYLAVEVGTRWFFPQTPQGATAAAVVVSMRSPSVATGDIPIAVIKNTTDTPLPLDCSNPPFYLFAVDPVTHQHTPLHPIDQGQQTATCPTPVAAKSSAQFPLTTWSAHVQEPGIYDIMVHAASGNTIQLSDTGSTARFTVSEPGFFVKTFRAFITKPLLNTLIFIASIVPGHNLGLSIILLTILVKLILFLPTQHALEGQKKMQLLQPKFDAVRKQYKDNPTKMQEETMKIWKEHKINPLQSCLPLLVQFPVLIGLFYVIRNGANLELSRHLIYPIYQNLSWTFDQHFLGLDLTKPYVWIFPPMLVILQFLQIKLSLVIANKKKAKDGGTEVKPEAASQQDMQQKIMLYVLPLLIGYFAITYPSALSLYWGVSTLFAIGQQLLVNREHIRP